MRTCTRDLYRFVPARELAGPRDKLFVFSNVADFVEGSRAVAMVLPLYLHIRILARESWISATSFTFADLAILLSARYAK